MLCECAIKDKPTTLFLDEFRLLDDSWFNDLECLLKNNISTETIRKSDFIKIVTNIYKEIEKEKRGAKLGLSAEELKKEKLFDQQKVG